MKKHLRQLFLIFSLTSISVLTWGQSCSCISGIKDKEKGVEIVSGITNTSDYYVLLVQKIMNYEDTTISPKYRLFLNVPTKVLFSDSSLKTFSTIELKLLDNSKLILDNVEYKNNPLGDYCTLGFWVYVTEETIKTLSINPIVTITVKDIISSSFTSKRQKEQQKIYNCLYIRKPK